MRTVKNIHRNIMGTISFDAKFEGMRKEQDFIVYPMNEKTETISCQSDSRWLSINVKTGSCEITSSQSGHHNSWMLAIQSASGKSKKFTLDESELIELKAAIFKTGGKSVGRSIVLSDNSAAKNIFDL